MDEKPTGEWKSRDGVNWAIATDTNPPFQRPVPEPGTICPTCRNMTPTKAALHMREYRKARKE